MSQCSNHICVGTCDDERTLYFFEWDPRLENRDYEFRVFVKDGTITAISQQEWFEHVHVLDGWDQTDVETLYEMLDGHLQTAWKPYVPRSCCLDVWCDLTDTVFIEANPYEYSSGSSLFHWEIDRHKLDDLGNVYFRCVGGVQPVLEFASGVDIWSSYLKSVLEFVSEVDI